MNNQKAMQGKSISLNSKAEMPVVFFGHGSPMNIIDDNKFTRAMVELGSKLPKPKAILVISAHWLTERTFIQASKSPKIIYDFSGFPESLYQVKYPVAGAPELAKTIEEQIPSIKPTEEWGLDHGTWSILVHMFPDYQIPVLQLSLNQNLSSMKG